MKEQSPQEKCPMSAPQPSVRYIRQGSNSVHSSCGSSDVGGAGRQQQQRIASSTNDVDDVEGGALPLPTNNFYHPHRCNNVSNNNNKNYRDNNNGSSASPPHTMVVDTSSSLHHNNMNHHRHRIRSTSMPHQSTKHQRRSTSLVRKQTYTDHDTTGEEQDGDGMIFSKKQLSFQQQLLRQQPPSSFEKTQQQQPLPRKQLSFEQQLLHQKPLSPQKQLSFEQQLLQQEPPPPFNLPRSLSESLTPSHTDFPSSMSFEQQLLQQPEMNANQIGGIGVSSSDGGDEEAGKVGDDVGSKPTIRDADRDLLHDNQSNSKIGRTHRGRFRGQWSVMKQRRDLYNYIPSGRILSIHSDLTRIININTHWNIMNQLPIESSHPTLNNPPFFRVVQFILGGETTEGIYHPSSPTLSKVTSPLISWLVVVVGR